MKIKGLKFKEGSTDLYFGSIKAEEFVKKYDTNLWRPDIFQIEKNPMGYQRTLSEPRAREFGRFINNHGIAPLPILINFREGVVKANNDGTLDLPDTDAYIVDGQHRAAGYSFAMQSGSVATDYEVPIIIMNVNAGYDEAKQFVIINRTQKGIRADLAERFLMQAIKEEGRKNLVVMSQSGVLRKVLKNVDWVTKAIDITDSMNSDKNSPWFEKIQTPNSPKGGAAVAQKSFTESLQPILKNDFFVGKDSAQIASALRNYWNAIRELCVDAFNEPKEYVLQKTSGVTVMHKIFPRVSELCTDLNGNRVLTKESFVSLLKPVQAVDSEFWASNGEAARYGTNRQGLGFLSDSILEDLESQVQKKKPDMII
jgi:DGQHR domain-containing protein